MFRHFESLVKRNLAGVGVLHGYSRWPKSLPNILPVNHLDGTGLPLERNFGLESRSPRRWHRSLRPPFFGLAALGLLGLLALAALPLASCHPIAAIERRWAQRARPPFRKVTP